MKGAAKNFGWYGDAAPDKTKKNVLWGRRKGTTQGSSENR